MLLRSNYRHPFELFHALHICSAAINRSILIIWVHCFIGVFQPKFGSAVFYSENKWFRIESGPTQCTHLNNVIQNELVYYCQDIMKLMSCVQLDAMPWDSIWSIGIPTHEVFILKCTTGPMNTAHQLSNVMAHCLHKNAHFIQTRVPLADFNYLTITQSVSISGPYFSRSFALDTTLSSASKPCWFTYSFTLVTSCIIWSPSISLTHEGLEAPMAPKSRTEMAPTATKIPITVHRDHHIDLPEPTTIVLHLKSIGTASSVIKNAWVKMFCSELDSLGVTKNWNMWLFRVK